MSSTETIKKKDDVREDEIEIRLSDIVQFLRDSRKTILYWALSFCIIGILYALSQPDEFTASVKVMPELKTSAGVAGGLGDLRSLAGLAGVNIGSMGGTSDAIRPDLYPDIIQSVPFSLYLLKQPVTTVSSSKPQTLETYFSTKNESGFASVIGKLFGSKSTTNSEPISKAITLQLTRQQEVLNKVINARVNALMDKKSGIITITSQMPDAIVSATVAQQTLNYLTNYVTDYRTGKARQQVKFLNQQVNEARRRYQATENQLSNYRDRNQNLFLNTAKIEEQRIQADYLLAQGVYNDLQKQLEQARIKVQEEAPVFQVLEPPIVPLRKSGPKRTMLVISFTLLGAFLGLAAFAVRRFTRRKLN